MFRRVAGLCGIGFLGLGVFSLQTATSQQTQAAAPAPSSPAEYRAVLAKYCFTCHNEKLKTAGLALDKMDLNDIPAGAETWEKVIAKLRGNAMPPPKMPHPGRAFQLSFATFLENTLDRAAFAKLNPGRPAIHRLNRVEYANAVHDILAVDIDGEALLPADDSGYGFDNIGDVLSVSPTLLERYLAAARTVSRLALGDSSLRPTEETYMVSKNLVQNERMSEDLPLRSRGGLAVRHYFSADGEYKIKLRMQRDGDPVNGEGGPIRGVALKRQLDLRVDKAPVKLFTVGGEHYGESGNEEGGGGDPRQKEYESYGADANLEIQIAVKAGPHLVGAAFLQAEDPEPEGVFRGRSRVELGRRGGKNAEPGVASITISGPYNAKSLGQTPSREKIFICRPAGTGNSPQVTNDEPCARKILSTLAHRAYRRPVTDVDLQHLLRFYKEGKAKSGFEGGVQLAIERMLVGPEFLFRYEQDPPNLAPGSSYQISSLDLASRLSFFLWSTVPDDQLLDLAERGKLKDPAVLEQQARRMLADPRSKAFTRNFFGQWFQLRLLADLAPDASELPEYDENLKVAFQEETELFLDSMVREDHPLMELLNAKYTFLNERLARHYQIPGVYGSTFRRVALDDSEDIRRGLLGQGSILSLTSYPNRTSVVLRGVWLLSNILATEPPPPPPNVPPLKDRGADGRIKSVRESMEEHRANPACASCHLRMDPLGFAMENFNAIGQWRTTEGPAKTPIDSSGMLPDGTKFNGPVELRNILLGQPDQFATAVTEKLLTYAMGRGVEYSDMPVVRKIKRVAGPDYRWTSLILGVVKSEPFQMRRTRQQ